MIGGLSASITLGLFVLAFLAGLITASVGPGGLFFVVGLSLLTPLTTPEIAGTAGGVFVVGSALATGSYARSEDIHYPLALVLSVASVVGVRGGVWANATVSAAIFEGILALIVLFGGASMVYREVRGLTPLYQLDPDSGVGLGAVAAIGAAVGVTGGLTGIGGPALSVPALVLLGIPVVRSVGAAMVQALFITTTTAGSYALAGEVIWELAFLFAFPFAVGSLAGWLVAHRLPERLLKLGLGGLLVLLSGVLVVL